MESGEFWTINSKFSLESCQNHLEKLFNEKHYVTVRYTVGKPRTNTQNNALQVYCRELAKALNDAGLDMKQVLKPEVDIPWNQDAVREHLWKPVQKAVIQKESTTEANTADYSKVYDVLNRHLAEKFGISIPFPSRAEHDSGNLQTNS